MPVSERGNSSRKGALWTTNADRVAGARDDDSSVLGLGRHLLDVRQRLDYLPDYTLDGLAIHLSNSCRIIIALPVALSRAASSRNFGSGNGRLSVIAGPICCHQPAYPEVASVYLPPALQFDCLLE
jgi:hypothetical protein